jgi:hypothetical protein
MLSIRTRRVAVMLLSLAVTALLAWWWTRADERARFLNEVEEILATANRGEHVQILEKLSPEARQRIADDFMPPGAALAWVARIDANQDRAYRLVNLSVFLPRDYAEIEVERSGPGREFTGERIFPVPFVWRNGKWWVAGNFRSEREWAYPE